MHQVQWVKWGPRETVQWVKDQWRETSGKSVGRKRWGSSLVTAKSSYFRQGWGNQGARWCCQNCGRSWNLSRERWCQPRMQPDAERRKEPGFSFLLLASLLSGPPIIGSYWEASWRGVWDACLKTQTLGKGRAWAQSNKPRPAWAECSLNLAIPRLSLFRTSRWMLSWLAMLLFVPVLASPKFRILLHCHLSTRFLHL